MISKFCSEVHSENFLVPTHYLLNLSSDLDGRKFSPPICLRQNKCKCQQSIPRDFAGSACKVQVYLSSGQTLNCHILCKGCRRYLSLPNMLNKQQYPSRTLRYLVSLALQEAIRPRVKLSKWTRKGIVTRTSATATRSTIFQCAKPPFPGRPSS